MTYKSLNTEVSKLIKDGKVGITPTDTVYGLVASAADEQAVARLYSLKKRQQKPGPIIAASIEQLVSLGIKARYLKPVAHYWPNPISIEIPHSIGYLNQGTGRQAFRIVKDKDLAKFLKQTGPLLTTSANQPDEPTAKNIQEAKAHFGEKVDFYVDGGELDKPASTIIRIIDDAVDVVREGSVKLDEAGRILK